MIFKHRKTELPALWITPYNPNWKNQNDPNLFRIRSYEDLPDPQPYYSLLCIPIEIWQGQGKRGLYQYFRAFIQEDNPESVDDFWFFLVPSGFPDEKIPGN